MLSTALHCISKSVNQIFVLYSKSVHLTSLTTLELAEVLVDDDWPVMLYLMIWQVCTTVETSSSLYDNLALFRSMATACVSKSHND